MYNNKNNNHKLYFKVFLKNHSLFLNYIFFFILIYFFVSNLCSLSLKNKQKSIKKQEIATFTYIKKI